MPHLFRCPVHRILTTEADGHTSLDPQSYVTPCRSLWSGPAFRSVVREEAAKVDGLPNNGVFKIRLRTRCCHGDASHFQLEQLYVQPVLSQQKTRTLPHLVPNFPLGVEADWGADAAV